MKEKEIVERVIALGAYRASVIGARDVPTDPTFRQMCAQNICGLYGRCYMCPPDVGEIDALMAQIGEYRRALVYQTVTELEDSFDFEGMVAAKKQSYLLAQGIREALREAGFSRALHLGAGGCGVCESCAKQTGEPCRFPERAMPSLEAYGVNVSLLAKAAGMKYVNGQNTVTYFGAVLFSWDGDGDV